MKVSASLRREGARLNGSGWSVSVLAVSVDVKETAYPNRSGFVGDRQSQSHSTIS